ncbi:MAG: hypothetical protein MJ252_08760 [archaeon]|nr:hypothetical protein [archaeon]
MEEESEYINLGTLRKDSSKIPVFNIVKEYIENQSNKNNKRNRTSSFGSQHNTEAETQNSVWRKFSEEKRKCFDILENMDNCDKV